MWYTAKKEAAGKHGGASAQSSRQAVEEETAKDDLLAHGGRQDSDGGQDLQAWSNPGFPGQARRSERCDREGDDRENPQPREGSGHQAGCLPPPEEAYDAEPNEEFDHVAGGSPSNPGRQPSIQRRGPNVEVAEKGKPAKHQKEGGQREIDPCWLRRWRPRSLRPTPAD